MSDILEIGAVPTEEDCQQVGTPGYNPDLAKAECHRFIAAIRSTVGHEPDGARLSIKANRHDFGTYYEVVCTFDERNDAAIDYAFRCESDAPTRWPETVTP